ncbi:MAG: DUF4236 domain-containing protein [Bifidobacteriaceae bacterium]|jgi:hypothetical protein|nr:DUF4236 domain-containing protein [Bifidobacteriaceae bacterium]
MAFRFRKTKSLGKGTLLNLSKGGASVSKRVGPLTVNSRGRASIRIAPGLSFGLGGRRKRRR